jgi:predicted methyltransferase
MNKLYSKINNLQDSYHLEQATERGEEVMTLKTGVHNFYDNLCLYCSNNNIDLTNISDDEFNACEELLQDFAKASQTNSITFSISK